MLWAYTFDWVCVKCAVLCVCMLSVCVLSVVCVCVLSGVCVCV